MYTRPGNKTGRVFFYEAELKSENGARRIKDKCLREKQEMNEGS